MSEEWQVYVEDPRTICKFGAKCYQKNAEHHLKYKHPPVKNKHKVDTHKGKNRRFSPYSREKKKEDSGENVQEVLEPASGHDRQYVEESVICDQKDDLHIKTALSNDQQAKVDQKGDLDIKTVLSNDQQAKVDQKGDLDIKTVLSNDQQAKVDQKGDLDITTALSNDQQTEVEKSFMDIVLQLSKKHTFHKSSIDQDKYKELFLVEMPPDFFKFYECLKEEKDMEKMLSSVNLQLIGPYELLMGKLPVLDNRDLYLIHWRFYYDPPEFQAVLKSKDKSEFHIGYYRDDPKAQPVFLASNDSSKGCHLTPFATNIFGAVYSYLEHQKKSPFTAMAFKKMTEKVKSWAEKHNYSIEEYNAKRRTNLSLAKTLHGAGIMVPYDKKTELGYRRLTETDANIRKLFDRLEKAKSESDKDRVLSELQPVITYANIAVDECDFGTGLEVGIDMFCSGLKELESSALNSLCSAYSLLNRAEFGTIIQAHLKCRRRGSDMSVLSIGK